MLIDTHCHIYDGQFRDDLELVLDRATRAGVRYLMMPAVDKETYEAMYDVARRYPKRCFPMMGLHPTSVNDNPAWRQDLAEVERLLCLPPEGIRFVGVGEVGLDLYWSRDFLPEQLEVLHIQAELAMKHDLPLILHTRDAWNEMCDFLSVYKEKPLRGILHSFSGEKMHYQSIKEQGGFRFGIGGPVTYKNGKLPVLIREMELEDLVLETDAPYLPPVPHRGERNESAYLPLVCHRIAELKGAFPEDVAQITNQNALDIFGNLES